LLHKRPILTAILIQFIIIIFLISCSVASTAKQDQGDTASSPYDLTPQQAWSMIRENKGNPNFVILDVRTPKEFFAAHIEGAVNLDFYALDFNKKLGKLDPAKTYLVYCKSGARSDAARKVMLKMGFKKIYNMLGGITDWKKAGLPVISGE